MHRGLACAHPQLYIGEPLCFCVPSASLKLQVLAASDVSLDSQTRSAFFRNSWVSRRTVPALTILLARSMNRLECEHSRAEQNIRDSEERMRLAHQVARMGAFDWNIQTGATLWSPELDSRKMVSQYTF